MYKAMITNGLVNVDQCKPALELVGRFPEAKQLFRFCYG